MARQGQDVALRRVDRVRRQIVRWRSKKERRTAPMPAGLWDEAAVLARELGVHRVKRALGLNYEALKRRVEGVGTGGRVARVAPPGFVELKGPGLAGLARAVVVEISDADGSRLTIQLGSGSDVDVAGLVEVFRRRK
ncbi:MAG: hypothetical protein OEY17_05725 [Nitrosopumilus sp.]|nr:hypothetical protein [Nitrosopumilus sp.]